MPSSTHGGAGQSGALSVPPSLAEGGWNLLLQKPAPGGGRAPCKGVPPGAHGFLIEEQTVRSPRTTGGALDCESRGSQSHCCLGQTRAAPPRDLLSRPGRKQVLLKEQGLWGSFVGLGLNPNFSAAGRRADRKYPDGICPRRSSHF